MSIAEVMHKAARDAANHLGQGVVIHPCGCEPYSVCAIYSCTPVTVFDQQAGAPVTTDRATFTYPVCYAEGECLPQRDDYIIGNDGLRYRVIAAATRRGANFVVRVVEADCAAANAVELA